MWSKEYNILYYLPLYACILFFLLCVLLLAFSFFSFSKLNLHLSHWDYLKRIYEQAYFSMKGLLCDRLDSDVVKWGWELTHHLSLRCPRLASPRPPLAHRASRTQPSHSRCMHVKWDVGKYYTRGYRAQRFIRSTAIFPTSYQLCRLEIIFKRIHKTNSTEIRTLRKPNLWPSAFWCLQRPETFFLSSIDY